MAPNPNSIYTYVLAAHNLVDKTFRDHGYALVVPGTGSFITRKWDGTRANYLISKRFSDLKDIYNREYSLYSYLFRCHRSEGNETWPSEDTILQYGASFTILRMGYQANEVVIPAARILTIQAYGHRKDTKVWREAFWSGLGASEFTKTSQPYVIGKFLWLPVLGEKLYKQMLQFYGNQAIEVNL